MQVTPGIHLLRLPFTIRISDDLFLERFVNTFIIAGPSITLVDAGVAGSRERIFEYIRSIGRDPAEIRLLILTHSHPDHIGGARAIRDATGCAVAAHAAERAWIEDVNLQCNNRPVPGFHTLVGGPVAVDHLLEDGEVLELGTGHQLDCVVFHTPGHSQGSVSLLVRSGGVLITGDAVPVLGALPVYDDVLASAESILRLMGIDGISILLSSWDEPRRGIDAYQKMREGLTYLQHIHDTVLRMACVCPHDPMELAGCVAAELGLPPETATPLLARTCSAHLLVCDRPDLLSDGGRMQPAGSGAKEADQRRLLT